LDFQLAVALPWAFPNNYVRTRLKPASKNVFADSVRKPDELILRCVFESQLLLVGPGDQVVAIDGKETDRNLEVDLLSDLLSIYGPKNVGDAGYRFVHEF
jgi:hypothetical protein